MTKPERSEWETELACIGYLPVYTPPKPEDEDDRYLLRGAVLGLVASSKREITKALGDARRDLDADVLARAMANVRPYGGNPDAWARHAAGRIAAEYRRLLETA